MTNLGAERDPLTRNSGRTHNMLLALYKDASTLNEGTILVVGRDEQSTQNLFKRFMALDRSQQFQCFNSNACHSKDSYVVVLFQPVQKFKTRHRAVRRVADYIDHSVYEELARWE